VNESNRDQGLDPSLIASGAARVDPKDQLKFRLTVDPFERASDRVAGDAVLIDIQDFEKVLWNVIEGPQDNNVVFFEVPVCHSDLRVKRRSWRIARSRLSFARSIQDKVSRKPTPAAKSSKKGVVIYTSP
jgi:hypothetical protein